MRSVLPQTGEILNEIYICENMLLFFDLLSFDDCLIFYRLHVLLIFLLIFAHHNILFFLSRMISQFFDGSTLPTPTTKSTIVGNTFDRTVVRIIIWRFTQTIECGNIWSGCDYEHIWCHDELFRFICGTIAERVFLSQSCHCRFAIVFTRAGIDLICKKYATHFGHIQCHQWWVSRNICSFSLFIVFHCC